MTNDSICSEVDLSNDLNDVDAERRELAQAVLAAAVDLAMLRMGATDSFEEVWRKIFSRAELRWDIVAGDLERQRAAERLSNEAERLSDLNVDCPVMRRRLAA